MMVNWLGGYCGEDFKCFKGATQGDPLSPTILNVVVEKVVWYWVAWPGAWGTHMGGGGMWFTTSSSSIWTMAWLRPPTLTGFMSHSAPPLGYLTGWGFVLMLGRRLGCSDAPDVQPGLSQKRCMRDGWQGRDSHSGPASGWRLRDQNVDRTWRQVWLRHTDKTRMLLELGHSGIPHPLGRIKEILDLSPECGKAAGFPSWGVS